MFTPNTQRIVPSSGNPNAPICIVGDFPSAEDERILKPFAGPSGTILESCLHAAGLTRHNCYLTNVLKIRPRYNELEPYFNSRTGAFTRTGNDWLDSLEQDLSNTKSNVIIPLGAFAMAALTGRKSISKYRGYITESLPRYGTRKVLPTYHPSASLRGQYILRYYITADFRKGKIESLSPQIIRPSRTIVIIDTLNELQEWFKVLLKVNSYACDIEVENFEVSAISFAIDKNTSISILLNHNHWQEDEEYVVWNILNKILNTRAYKIFQNGIFDIAFLMSQCGIHVSPPYEDTMIAHHIMYPEMLKGLGFLGSMYCGAQEYWKDMIKFDNIKEES